MTSRLNSLTGTVSECEHHEPVSLSTSTLFTSLTTIDRLVGTVLVENLSFGNLLAEHKVNEISADVDIRLESSEVEMEAA